MAKRTEKLNLDVIIDPLAARVLVEDGEARFDIAGVPRVDHLLLNKPAAQVPTMVTRLCGLCPVTHHLAGMAALDAILGRTPSARARATRSLLHHGSVLDVMGPRLLPAHALEVKKAGKLVLDVAGCPGHFPDVAIPGGVRALIDAQRLDELRTTTVAVRALFPERSSATALKEAELANVVVCAENGEWDPLGGYLRASLGDESEVIPAAHFSSFFREENPGSITPRPKVRINGTWHPYRVGPAARHPGLSPHEAQLESLRDSLDAIDALVESWEGLDGEAGGEYDISDGEGIGLVDGPRGLLVHHYRVADGTLLDCQILSPTAQNEGWLSAMLTRAVAAGADPREIEAAIRAADPCLPCTSAPEGKMNVTVVRA